MHVRPATPGDLAAVRRLTLAFGTRGDFPDDAAFATRYAEILADPDWLLLVADDAGYLLAQDFGPGLRATWTVGQIHDLYVDPAARRRGVGRALMAGAEAWARSRPQPMILDWQASSTGVEFYEALGFEADRTGDYTDYPGFCLDLRPRD